MTDSWPGWETCETCEGDPHKIDRWTCPDCAHGLVPPAWQVEAAARGAWPPPMKPGHYELRLARAALLAAARARPDDG